jgi:predicted ATPase/class 3 adenylate cyclase
MAALPSGTVTMVFSDIEGSTLLLSRLGDAYVDALDGQRAVLRSAWVTWNGSEMGTEGDSFFVVFETVRDAVNATLQAQREMARHSWPNGERVRVRVGMHTGEPVAHDGGYVGMDVHRAARVAGVAHGGQIVITDASRRIVGDQLPADARLVDLGWHRLKDLKQPEHLFQLGADPVETFPPLRSLGTATSLPREPTPLLGRDGELEELRTLLAASGARLVTLTGPGGSGKTRLAVALAAELSATFPDGVYFVALADVTTGPVLWATIAQSLGEGVQSDDRSALLEYVGSRHLLLVLDNLEQLPDAAPAVDELMTAAPHVTLIATSRTPLHLRGEHEHAVPPLELPASSDRLAAETSGAVQLFCQQARMVRSQFALTDDNAAQVVDVCRRLDGLPLAIELAAARIKLLTPAGLLSRLDRTTGLSSPHADRPKRQQTLHATIEWSYELLPADLQTFFCRLGVFAGGADLDAVSAVGRATGDPLDAISALVDASLLSISENPEGEPRIQMLQTISDFAVDRLAATGVLEDARLLHARHYLDLARRLAPALHTGRQLATAERLYTEYANFRAALNWSLRPEDAEPPEPAPARVGLQLAAVLSTFWLVRDAVEGRRYLERALGVDSGTDTPERATALMGLAAVMDEHLTAPKELLEEALEISRRLGDLSGASQAMTDLGSWYLRCGEVALARELLADSMDVARRADDSVRLALAVHVLGEAEIEFGNPSRAVELFEESRELALRRGDEAWAVWEEHWIPIALVRCGRVQEAAEGLRSAVSKVLRFSDSLLDNRPGTMRGGLRRADGR